MRESQITETITITKIAEKKQQESGIAGIDGL